jgi:hypothetical protein
LGNVLPELKHFPEVGLLHIIKSGSWIVEEFTGRIQKIAY